MPGADPSRIFETLSAYWQTAALAAAIDLDLFTALGRRRLTLRHLAAQLDVDREALRVLCDTLVSYGLLRQGHGRYRSAPDTARFLDGRSPDSVASLTRFLNAPPLTTAFATLATAVRTGTHADSTASRAGIWATFAEATWPIRRVLAEGMAADLKRRRVGRGRILDVGSGSSPLGLALLKRSRTSSLVALDRPAVVRTAPHAAEALGLGDRVITIAGDALQTKWGGPYDLLLMVNVLDYFDLRGQARLLQKARRALAPGGALVVSAPILDHGRTSPPEAVAYNLLLLALGSAGRASTTQELRRRLRRAGFVACARSRDWPLVVARVPR
jgi:SAM-dependent methyltransferase